MINTLHSEEGRRFSQRPPTVYNYTRTNSNGQAEFHTDGVTVYVKGDKYTIPDPFIYWCGCYGASRKITEAFRSLGLDEYKVPRTKESNRPVKAWIRQHNMELKYPGMQAAQFAYLVDPANERAVNLFDPKPNYLEQMKEILHGRYEFPEHNF